ncbi:cation:proton antiporter [Streptomyces lydicus]|uniref:cation:proton antiporter domain-containing protein n=1 Tax=Streptomyces lydicus TaxID=47763 RepID=UPI0036F7601E
MLPAIVLLCLLFTWALVSDRMAHWSITAPIAFVVAGVVLAGGANPTVPFSLEAHSFKVLVEVVLAVLLFVDATEAREYSYLHRSVGDNRLLGAALPASVALATLLGALLFPGTNWWLLAVAALVVMPIDLAPIAGLLRDVRVPLRVRAALNIEGGFNDGLISPLFLFCVANLATAEGGTFTALVLSALKGAVLAVVIGSLVGLAAAWLVRRVHDAGWAHPAGLRTAALTLPFLTYATASLTGGNGFVAAFVAGLWYAATAEAVGHHNLGLVDEASQLMSLAVWFILGKIAADEFAHGVSWRVVVYALLALTLARFLPVWVALSGTGFSTAERSTIAWIGSRGVTSIVFALLAYIGLPHDSGTFIFHVMCATVLLSVVLHGITQEPIARWFARHPQHADEPGSRSGAGD